MHKPTLLLVGFGKLNSALSARFCHNFSTTAISKNPKKTPAVNHVSADLSTSFPTELKTCSFDYVVFCLSPGSYDEHAYRAVYGDALQHTLHALANQPPQRFFLVSSTSVYQQSAGEWVDETSPTNPTGFAGRLLLDAEKQLAKAPLQSTVIRFSGIYGSDRTRLLEQVRSGTTSSHGPSAFSNRIHETDAVGVMAHLLTATAQGQVVANCYIASDCHPAPLHEVTGWIAKQLGVTNLSPTKQANQGTARRSAGNKRCSNQRLLDSGYRFVYPDFKAGYGEMLQRWLR
jgi:nucleoside-diphosphate-sugar epimerase